MDGSPPDSSVHGIFQARVLEWGAIAFTSACTGQCVPLIPCAIRYLFYMVKHRYIWKQRLERLIESISYPIGCQVGNSDLKYKWVSSYQLTFHSFFCIFLHRWEVISSCVVSNDEQCKFMCIIKAKSCIKKDSNYFHKHIFRIFYSSPENKSNYLNIIVRHYLINMRVVSMTVWLKKKKPLFSLAKLQIFSQMNSSPDLSEKTLEKLSYIYVKGPLETCH